MSRPKYYQEFEILTVTPDPRPYNQQRQIYKPVNAKVGRELEITTENFYLPKKFKEKLLLAEAGQEKWPEVPENLVYTDLGWSRIMSQGEEPYQGEADLDVWADDDFESLYEE